jgi:hypothetical protein
MNKTLSIANALALIVVIAILGGVAGYVVHDVIEYRLPGGQWHALRTGDEKAIRILGMDLTAMGGAYIQTDQGHVYACYSTQCKLVEAPQVANVPDQGYYAPRYTPPAPPGEVTESVAIPYVGLCSGQANFVILKDSSVWSWDKVGCCEMGCFINLVYPVGGFLAGLVVGIVIVVVRRTRPTTATTGPTS